MVAMLQKLQSWVPLFFRVRLIKYCVRVEINTSSPFVRLVLSSYQVQIQICLNRFETSTATSKLKMQKIKDIEKVTNHDVKAGILIKEKFEGFG